MVELEDLNKLKVAELRAELQARGLDNKGVKAVLVERLREALEGDSEDIQEDSNDDAPETPEEDDKDEGLEVIQDNGEEVEEPQQEESEEEGNSEEKSSGEDEYQNHVEKEEEEQPTAEEEAAPVKQEEEEEEEDFSKKTDYEEAPMEDLAELKKENECDEINSSTVKEEAADNEMKQEVTEPETSEVKKEKEDEENQQQHERWEDRRGRKRQYSGSGSNQDSYNKRSRQDYEDVRVEDEPEFDKSVVALDWYNSDLSLLIDKDNRLSATPMIAGGFAYVWHGVRATYGATKGKIFYEIRIEDHLSVGSIEQEEQHPHVVRCGWSVDDSGMTLGEEPLSWGYGGTAKASCDLQFMDYGKTFGKGDVVGCFLDMESEPMTMSFTVNGENQGVCYEITRAEIGDSALFPHILTKNSSFKVNFGSEDHAFDPLTGYTFIGKIPVEELAQGTQGPEKKEDAEIIMMVGLPGAGKTTWLGKHVKEHPEKKYNVLGTNNLIDKMKVMGLPRRRNYAGRWENLIDKCTRCLNKLLHTATKRRRNYIIDQTNVYPSAQKRKIKGFVGCKRRAVVIFPTDEDLKSRIQNREKEEGKDVPDKAVLEMKANFKLPEVGEFFEEVEFIELQLEEASELLKKYNKEGEKAGYGQKNFYSGNQQGRRLGYVDRRGKYNNRGGGGYRGGWDRDRDRRGGFDRRDRGGWNRDRDRDRGNYRDNRSGGGGGYKDRGYRGGSGGGGGWQGGGGGGGGYKGGNQNKQGGNWGGSNQSNTQDYSNWGGSQGYGNQGTWGNQGYNSGYNWNQQYYGQQQQTPQQYWGQGYAAQTGYNTPGYAQAYGQGYGYGQQQMGQQQWGAYGQTYGTAAATNTGYSTQTAASTGTNASSGTQQYRK